MKKLREAEIECRETARERHLDCGRRQWNSVATGGRTVATRVRSHKEGRVAQETDLRRARGWRHACWVWNWRPRVRGDVGRR